MKLSSGIDALTKENRFLKFMTMGLLGISAILLGVVYTLYDKDPLIIERSSRGMEIVRVMSGEHTPTDLKHATALLLKARFDSSAVSTELFLNPKQLLLRDTEQKDMKSRGMSQNVIIKDVSFEKDQAVVDLDRIIAVGEVRSALRAKVRVAFEEISPNELNPYGLVLSLADPITQPEAK